MKESYALRLHFDRQPPEFLVRALTQEGPLGSILELIKSDPLWDLGFRSFSGRPAAFVYRGRSVVLRIVTASPGHLRLSIDEPKYRAAGFNASWNDSLPAEEFRIHSAAISDYLQVVASRVHASFTSGEAPIQAAVLHSSRDDAILIDREAVPGWIGSRVERDLTLDPLRTRYDQLAGRRCGKEADALALSADGTRLFVIECKPAKHRLEEAVAQACWYAALFRAWLSADPARAARQLEGMAAARAAIGLCRAIPFVNPSGVRAVVAVESVGDTTALLARVSNIAGTLARAPLYDDRAPLVALVGEGGMEIVSSEH